MRQILIFAFTLFIIKLSAQTKTIVSGVCRNLDQFDDERFYHPSLSTHNTIEYFNLYMDQWLDLNNEFKFELEVDYPLAVDLHYANKTFPIVLNPGDSIYLEFDLKLLIDHPDDLLNAVVVNGTGSELFKELYLFRWYLKNNFERYYRNFEQVIIALEEFETNTELSEDGKMWLRFYTHNLFIGGYRYRSYRDTITALSSIYEYVTDNPNPWSVAPEVFEKVKKKKLFLDSVITQERLLQDQNHSLFYDSTLDGLALIDHIKGRFPGKIVYIDFWNTSTRLYEHKLPFIKVIMDKYQYSDVVFVFLGTAHSEKLWKYAIARDHFIGHHYYLSSAQLKELLVFFNKEIAIHSAIIDHTGELIVPNAPAIADFENACLNIKLTKVMDDLLIMMEQE